MEWSYGFLRLKLQVRELLLLLKTVAESSIRQLSVVVTA